MIVIHDGVVCERFHVAGPHEVEGAAGRVKGEGGATKKEVKVA